MGKRSKKVTGKRKPSKARGKGGRRKAGRKAGKKKATKAKSKSVAITSRAALAREVGVSKGTMSRLLARDDCPISTKGPWNARDVKRMAAYRETIQEDRAAALHGAKGEDADEAAGLVPGTRAKLDASIKVEKLKQMRHDRKMKEGKTIDLEDVEAGWVSRARYFKATLYSMLRGMAPRVAAEDDPAKCEQMLIAAGDVLLEGYMREPLPGVDDPDA